MENHGIKKCEFVLDPTFLFDRVQWAIYEKEVSKCPKDYLLIYFLDTTGEDIVKLAKRIDSYPETIIIKKKVLYN